MQLEFKAVWGWVSWGCWMGTGHRYAEGEKEGQARGQLSKGRNMQNVLCFRRAFQNRKPVLQASSHSMVTK